MAGLPESWLGLAALVVVLIIWQLGRASLGSTLAHSDIRQRQSEALTRAVLDYVEGIGIAKTFNLLGERSAQLTENFARSRKVSIEFEGESGPWMRALYLVCGLGSVLMIPCLSGSMAGGSSPSPSCWVSCSSSLTSSAPLKRSIVKPPA